MQIIYGTGNDAKITYMQRALRDIPCEIIGLKDAANARGIVIPEVKEAGRTPLENARLKAEGYFQIFKCPVFSCDSGLYLWNHASGDMLPESLQPGIHVRGGGEVRLSDEELIQHYTALVKEYGLVRGRYKNAICLIWDEQCREESMEEDLWGESFLFTGVPHKKRVSGFPLDSISLDIETHSYFYDLEDSAQDDIVSEDGFVRFFRNFMEKYQIL
ncbi:non-canonical purine NTP pyrophosphatase [Parablautia muri]|uniref:Non-canonical purine NTP pyrophosphatase n=1 Tax=Parablautia muri TaxID=2320879 RepID=A0A9X5GQN0_9FIRM|nr:non-canonical purine NTP pyrophosphatase [Parablautia muri]NBJ91256.1 hypothetical protein [Parablautia muri]